MYVCIIESIRTRVPYHTTWTTSKVGRDAAKGRAARRTIMAADATQVANVLLTDVVAAVRLAPDCSPFYTPSGGYCEGAGCRQLLNVSAPLVACRTPPPPDWRREFSRSSVVRRDNIPTLPFNISTTKQFWKDGGLAAATKQAWMIQNHNRDFFVTLQGTCGTLCVIAKLIFEYVAKRVDYPPEDITFLEVAAGVSTVATCLSSVHNVGTTVSVTPMEERTSSDKNGHGMGVQSFVSVERGTPTMVDYSWVTHQLPIQPASFDAILACRACGGNLMQYSWFWYEAQRLLKPGGVLFIENEHARDPIPTPPPLNFCMELVPNTPKTNGEWGGELNWDDRYIGGHWRMYHPRMRAFRKLSLANCTLAHSERKLCKRTDGKSEAIENCLTPDTNASEHSTGSAAHAAQSSHSKRDSTSASNWEGLVRGMEPWLQLSDAELETLRQEDAQPALDAPQPGARLDPSLVVIKPIAPNATRVVSVLSVNAADHAFSNALRARSPRLWGMVPGTIKPTAITPSFQHAAPRAAIVNDLCRRPLPVHPRAYDVIVIEDAPGLQHHCAKVASLYSQPLTETFTHVALEIMRISRPGPLGLVVLAGDAAFASSVRDAYAQLTQLNHTRALRISLLGCTSHGQRHACVLRQE